MQLPAGTWLDWGGQFENLQRAEARLALVVPGVFALIAVLLYFALGSAALLTATVLTLVVLPTFAGRVLARRRRAGEGAESWAS